MGLTFKDYVTIADALEVDALDEGWMDAAVDAIKKKLGGKMSDDEIKAEIDKVKAKKTGMVAKVSDTQQSKDFHQRRADMAAKTSARQPQGTISTSARNQAARDRNADREWVGEDTLTEAQKEYKVEYTNKAGGSTKVAKIKGQDVTAVREKFKRDFHGMKILTVTPARVLMKKPIKVDEEFGPLGPRS